MWERRNPGKLFIPNSATSVTFNLSKALHNDRILCTGNVTGTLTIVLPPAVGDGCIFNLVNFGNISGSIIFKTRTGDVFRGTVRAHDAGGAGATFCFFGSSTNNTLTLNGTTFGNWQQGEIYKFTDLGTNLVPPQGHWFADCIVGSAAAPTTPFSTV